MGQIDTCVIGAGPAGAIVADKLAAAGQRVVLVERGPRFPSDARDRIIRRINDGDMGFGFAQMTDERLKGHEKNGLFGSGGSTVEWGADSPRPMPDDFEVRTRHGYGRDWPFPYAELEPWLLRAEHELGVAGNEDNPYAGPRSGPFPMPAHEFSYFDRELFLPACEKLGWTGHSLPNATNSVDFAGRPACNAARLCQACPNGARYAADRVHVARFEKRPNAEHLTESPVRRLVLSADGKRIEAAVVTTLDGKEKTIRASRFVVAGGGIESTRLLMLSADPRHAPNGLGNGGGRLGKGHHDHAIAFAAYRFAKPTGSRLGFPTSATDHFRRGARDKHGHFFISGSPQLFFEFFMGFDKFPGVVTDDAVSLVDLRQSIQREAVAGIMCEMSPEGEITLDTEEKDHWGDPVAKIRFADDDWERATLAAGLAATERLAEPLGAVAFAELFTHVGAYHPMGGCSIARTQDDGVCDPNGRVFGVDNLYMATGGTIPSIGAANVTLTIAALALRLAAHLGGAP